MQVISTHIWLFVNGLNKVIIISALSVWYRYFIYICYMCDYCLVNTSFIYLIFTKIVITALTILSLLFTVVAEGTTIDPIKLSTNRRVELITADRFIYVLKFIQFRKKADYHIRLYLDICLYPNSWFLVGLPFMESMTLSFWWHDLDPFDRKFPKGVISCLMRS